MAGSKGEADSYFRAAQAAYPISAEVSWKYGNFLLRQDRLPEAYAEIHLRSLKRHDVQGYLWSAILPIFLEV